MLQPFMERLRLRLGQPDALAPLAVLAVAVGLLAGLVVLSFRLLSELLLRNVVGLDDPEAFETLIPLTRLLLPVAGALLIALLFERAASGGIRVGIVHVMEQLADFRPDLPLRNACLQYIGALVCLVCGHSLGREGPGVHLGAAVSSWTGRALHAPNNSMRILIACGTAASIAAYFNTPIAGVIFAMEVVMMEYTIVGFMPVIVAAVVAAWLGRAVYGTAAAFDVPALQLRSLLELPFIVFVGVAVGLMAAAFICAVAWIQRRAGGSRPLWRFSAAGLVTGLCALAVPQVMGVGYDTVEQALTATLPVGLLVGIVLLKLIASAACVGLGLPAGLIGPTLVMGATAGAALGVLGQAAAPELSASPSLYALLGMGAMMGATLKAPLAALMAIVELTANVNIILPGMVCIVSATVTCHSLFGRDSIYVTMLRDRGIDYFSDPVALALSRSGVSSRMRRDFVSVPRTVDAARAEALCQGPARWLVVSAERTPLALVHVEALGALVEANRGREAHQVDLLEAPLRHHGTASISLRATLQEARLALARHGVGTLCVQRERRGREPVLCGILTETELRH